ncbi:MAG: hypothetical protein TUN42_07260 [Dehalogenimonas sp.]
MLNTVRDVSPPLKKGGYLQVHSPRRQPRAIRLAWGNRLNTDLSFIADLFFKEVINYRIHLDG